MCMCMKLKDYSRLSYIKMDVIDSSFEKKSAKDQMIFNEFIKINLTIFLLGWC